MLGIRSPKMSVPDEPTVIPLCITDVNELYRIKKRFNPTHVIHGAGVCDLDVCEERPSWAEALNRGGARAIATVFGESSHLFYISSDLVFSGNTPPAGGYREEHTPDPVSIAGKTIENAEREIAQSRQYCIVRIGLPIGRSITGDKGAIDFVRSRFSRSLPVTLFHDEYRSCISCDDISKSMMEIVRRDVTGLYHLGGPERVSLHRIGSWVLQQGNFTPALLRGISRFEEKNGPPRIGDVSLDSLKISELLPFTIGAPLSR